MSDFDEEAEREKLRERFAEEEQQRETSERMSELLLQGATMTDTHCDNCGDPLFRYDGQTFCPTCQRAAGDSADTATEQEPTPEQPADGQRSAANDPRDQPAGNNGTATQSPSTASGGQPTEPASGRREPPSQSAEDAGDSVPHHPDESTNDLAATEASLSRTLRQLTNTAEQLDDLGRTREHLAAAREAAEALSAVRTARR